MFIKLIKNIQNNINKSVFFVFLFISIFIGFVSSTGDLLDQAFKPSMIQQGLIDLGNDKDAVGNEILKGSINVNFGDGVSVERRAPLIVRIAKLLLRMTIVLSITMILYNGVLYIVQSSKGESPKDPQKNLINIGIGIIIALGSLGIINLISSISISSIKTSEDLGSLSIGCKVGITIVSSNDLKRWICLNSTFGNPTYTMQYRIRNSTRPGNRCRFADNSIFTSNGEILYGKDPSANKDGEWKNITQSEMKSKCVQDMGGIVVE